MSNLDTQNKYLKYRFDQIMFLLSKSEVVLFSIPTDKLLYSFFKENKKFGSSDRSFISDCLFFYIRHKSYIDTYSSLLNKSDPYCPLFLSYLLSSKEPEHILDGIKNGSFPFMQPTSLDAIQEHYQDISSFHFYEKNLNSEQNLYSLPSWLVENLKQSYPDYYIDLFKSFLERASTTIRVNTLKTSKSKILDILDKKNIRYHLLTHGIAIDSKIHLESLEEYKSGLFEVQDESSQIICSEIDLTDCRCVVDYCAGAGGKSLNLATKFQNSNFYCHDVRKQILVELRKRAIRANLANIHLLKHNNTPLNVDCLILDVPCSGLGTLRRSPWLKWSLTKKKIKDITSLQLSIVDEAINRIKPTKKIIYITCSVLEDENEKNSARILKKYPNLSLVKERKTNPCLNPDTDGMYMAEFQINGPWN